MIRPPTLLRQLIALAVIGLITTSCNKQPDMSAPVPVDNIRTLDFWHIQTYEPTGPAVAAAVQRAADSTPGLFISTEAIKNDPFKTKLATAMGAGAGPDVFHTWGGGGLGFFADNQMVTPLDGKLKATTANLHPAALDFCRHQGKLYAIPVDVGVVPVWYNRQLFAQHQLQPPTTIAEFETLCATLKAKGITPLALGNAKSWPGAFYFMYAATRYGGTNPIQSRAFQDPAFIKAGAWIQKLVNADYFSEGFNGLDYDDARRQFFAGDAAMLLMGNWLVAQAKSEAPDFLPNLGSFAFPGAGTNPDWDATVVGGVNAAYAVSAKSPEQEASLILLRHLADEVALKAWAETGRIPALTPAKATELLGDDLGVANIFYQAKHMQLYYDQLLQPELALIHKETTQAIFAGMMTPEVAAEKMATTANRLK